VIDVYLAVVALLAVGSVIVYFTLDIWRSR